LALICLQRLRLRRLSAATIVFTAIPLAQHIEENIAPGGDLDPISGLANKSPEHAARIAAVLTIFENEDALDVSVDHLSCGIDLVQHHLNEAIRLLGMAQVDNELHEARKLLDWLHTKWKESFISIKPIVRLGPSSIRDTKTAKRLVAVLVEHNLLLPAPQGTVVDGTCCRNVWQVVREA
jgi:hypothetical protein